MSCRLPVLFWLGVLLSAPAAAAPTCEPFGEADLIGLVLSAQSAADRDNQDTLAGLLEEIRREIPCLVGAPPPRLLADYFVLEAVYQFGKGGDWHAPLDAALRIHPDVYRGVGSSHPIATYAPAPPAGESRPAPADAKVYVDGLASDTLPPAGEMHLVQVAQGSLWRSEVVYREPVTDDWLRAPIRVPLVVVPWGQLGLVLGAGGVAQRRGSGWPVSAGQNDFIPDSDWYAAWPATVVRGGLDYGRLGILADLDVGLASFVRPIGSHVQGAIVVRTGPVSIGAGAGLGASVWTGGGETSSPDQAAEYDRTIEPLSYGYATVMRRATTWDGALTAGYGAAVTRGSLRVALVRQRREEDLAVRIGLSGVAQQGRFVQLDGATARNVGTLTWHGGLELGVGR